MNSINRDPFKAQYNIAVIGAGISGLGVACEALKRGYSVILFERAIEVASGTSANSLRIIHGGFRYLQSLSIDRVIGSINAQAHLAQRFPDLLRPLPCVMQLQRFGLKSKLPVMCAAAAFKVVAKGLRWPPKENLPQVLRSVPDSKILHATPNSILKWWDWQLTSHTALANALKDEITRGGAMLQTGALVTEIKCERVGVKVILESGEEITAHCVVDCRGSGVPSAQVNSSATAFNLLLSSPLDPIYGVGFAAGKRLLFAVPRADKTTTTGAVGTWYLKGADPFSPEKPHVTEEQICAAIDDVNFGLPNALLTRDMVIDVEAGVLPCASPRGINPPKLLARERIETYERIVKVISTKYTTFATQARWAVDAARDMLK